MTTVTPKFPNKWSIDNVIDNNELIYTFNTYNEFEDTDAPENSDISSNFYKRLTISREDKNIKYKEQIYTLNGFYLTTYSDKINDVTPSNYYLIIETRNISNLGDRAYLYLSIPIIETTEDTPFNNLLTDMENNTSTIHRVDFNFNEFIPNENFYYYNSINKIFNVNRKVDWILFPKGKLSAKITGLPFTNLTKAPEEETYTSGLDPLSISGKIPRYVDYIQSNVNDDGIYIDCSPVDDINNNDETLFFSNFTDESSGGIGLSNEYVKYFIIFIIGLIVIILVLNIGRFVKYLFITNK